ncbi:glutathione S-transferase family protein [Pantanalinema sp. GBBB05]|uniref:glutathione S-transferase family protein n=1 Tax=Pantanalinema sp. GBBB05 TaxID=2604139 RepID=UPI001D9261EF|nr:glutathione S-transferase family protein [Pantanalinema sp. GBBB05]
MLKFYYNPLSVNARRVWVALLEKQIPFEPVLLKLNGDQFQAEFTETNPFQQVPVLFDQDFRIIESLAILDYLEAKFPSPPLMPKEAHLIAIVRMVEMITVNELQPATVPLMKQMMQMEVAADILETANQRILKVLQFYEDLLGTSPYFAGEEFTLAEVVAGTLITALPMFNVPIANYPRLDAWLTQLETRDSWKQTAPSPMAIAAAMGNIKQILKRR